MNQFIEFVNDRHRLHFWLTLVWLFGGAFVNWILGWQYLVPWVAFMSLYANVVGHWSAMEAAKAAKVAAEEVNGAVQESGAAEVDVRERSKDGETLGEGNA